MTFNIETSLLLFYILLLAFGLWAYSSAVKSIIQMKQKEKENA